MKTQAELAGELFAVGWAAGHRECDTTRLAQLEDIKRQLRRATWHEGSNWNGDLSGLASEIANILDDGASEIAALRKRVEELESREPLYSTPAGPIVGWPGGQVFPNITPTPDLRCSCCGKPVAITIDNLGPCCR